MPRVIFEQSAAVSLDDLPKTIKARMIDVIVRLAAWPNISGAKPLSGQLAGKWRIRTGDYRIQFRIERDEVVIEQLGHRDGFYEE
jgi:mRNA interferase RelE/StbE